MRIHEHGNVIILLAASSALFAQSNDFPQNLSSAPIGQIVESSIAATLRILQGRVKYTYLERDESRRLDPLPVNLSGWPALQRCRIARSCGWRRQE